MSHLRLVPPSTSGPLRPRADLVPLHDEERLGGEAGQWFLGATGMVAHLPAPPDTLAATLLDGDRVGLAVERTACGVLLTQVRAGREVEPCGLCLIAEFEIPSLRVLPGGRTEPSSQLARRGALRALRGAAG